MWISTQNIYSGIKIIIEYIHMSIFLKEADLIINE